MITKAPDVHLPDVHAWLAVDYPLAHDPSHAASTSYPVGVEPRRHEEPSHMGLAQDELSVRSEGLGSVGELDDLSVPDSRNPSACRLEERGEPTPVRFEQPVVKVRGDAIERERCGTSAVPPGYHVALVRAEVNKIVWVTHGWEVRRNRLAGLHMHVLVLKRNKGYIHTDEPADLRSPDARGVHHHLRPDGATIGDDLLYVPRVDGYPGHLHLG